MLKLWSYDTVWPVPAEMEDVGSVPWFSVCFFSTQPRVFTCSQRAPPSMRSASVTCHSSDRYSAFVAELPLAFSHS